MENFIGWMEEIEFIGEGTGTGTGDGGGPPEPFVPSLDFSIAANSMYLALVSVGGM